MVESPQKRLTEAAEASSTEGGGHSHKKLKRRSSDGDAVRAITNKFPFLDPTRLDQMVDGEGRAPIDIVKQEQRKK